MRTLVGWFETGEAGVDRRAAHSVVEVKTRNFDYAGGKKLGTRGNQNLPECAVETASFLEQQVRRIL